MDRQTSWSDEAVDPKLQMVVEDIELCYQPIGEREGGRDPFQTDRVRLPALLMFGTNKVAAAASLDVNNRATWPARLGEI